jgi:PEP-CTERM/exosortase A-associated glycosyltransferase
VDDALVDGSTGERGVDRGHLHEVGSGADDVCYGRAHGRLGRQPLDAARAHRFVSRYPGPFRAAAWALRRPRSAVELVRHRKLWLVLVLSDGLPRVIRRVVYAPIATVSGMALRRRGPHRLAGPMRVVALHGLGDDQAAIMTAEQVGTSADDSTARRLARIALAIEAPVAAEHLLDRSSFRASDDPAILALRGESELRLGRYGPALQLLERALAGRATSDSWERLAAEARAELALLDPGWRPSTAIPSGGRHGEPVRGRIVHLLTNSLPYRPAGYGVRAQAVACCQQAVGLDPRMVTRAGFPGTEGVLGAAQLDDVEGVPYHRIRPDLAPGVSIATVADETARGLDRLVRELRPTLLQPTTNYVNGQAALAVAEAYRLPVVYEVRGFLEETWRSQHGDAIVEGERYTGARAIETEIMRRVDAVVTLSETMRDDIVGRGGIDSDRVVVIPNAVDVERFVPGPGDPALAQRLGIRDGEPVVGYVSSLVAYEGIDGLIDAVALLRDRGRRVRLLLVGDGTERKALETRAEAAGMARDRTAIFTGRVPHGEIQDYYRLIDVFVVPRTADRVSQLVTPLKPYEAMAMERALVVSDVAALLEIVREDETGRTFRAGDPGHLAEVIEEQLDDPDTRARLGAAARAWVAQNRTWAGNGQRYLELYRRLGVA